MARKMPIRQSRTIAKIFVQKFTKYWNHHIVTGFLDLIARSNDCCTGNGGADSGGLGDVCDFVLSEIEKHRKARGRLPPFSFGKRTMTSVIALANEWHACVLQEAEAQTALERAQNITNRQAGKVIHTKISRWNGINLSCSRIEDDNFVWSFTQLCDVHSLLNEGRTMKNCISSYAARCASGDSAIFHVSRIFKVDQVCENSATLEVTRERILVQAKAKCNARLSSGVKTAVRKWAQLNRIKFGVSD